MKLLWQLGICSLLSALLVGGFLEILNFAVQCFQMHWLQMIWLMPMAGIALYYLGELKFFKNCESENSPALVPYLYLASTWSHLFGASVGREGAAIQIGGSVAEYLRRKLKSPSEHEDQHRALLTTAGTAAAFCIALATPISAVLFALEYKRKFSRMHWLTSLWAVTLATGVSWIWKVPHWHAPEVHFDWSEVSILGILGVSIFLGMMVLAYAWCERIADKYLRRVPSWLTLPASGMILGLAVVIVQHSHFNNFSTELLDQGFISSPGMDVAFGKILFTFISLVGGWKGGAFVPLMVSGGLFGSAIGQLFGLPVAVAAAIGVFSLVHRKFTIPWTCIFMSAEIFDWRMGVLCLPLHLMIYFLPLRK